MDVRDIWEDILPKLKVQRIKWTADNVEIFGVSPLYVTEVDGMQLTFDTKTGHVLNIANLRAPF
jgi:hypothetical protein